MRKVAVVGSASGNGKTTFGRALAARLGVSFVEMDALVHGPNWVETPDDELRRLLEPTLAEDGWVIDGGYFRKIGDMVIRDADTVVWIDLPIRVWCPRLLKRTFRRLRGRELIWNDNRETLRGAFWGRDSLFGFALRSHFLARKLLPSRLAGLNVFRLRSQAEVTRFLERSC